MNALVLIGGVAALAGLIDKYLTEEQDVYLIWGGIGLVALGIFFAKGLTVNLPKVVR